MTVGETIAFIGIAGLAAYVQTLTGFAFGLLVMGAVGLSALLPLPEAAVVVSVLTLANAGHMLTKGWRDVLWREFRLVILASFPCLALGYAILDHLAGTAIGYLSIILGMVILVSALQLLRTPETGGRRSKPRSFLFFGAISGLMGGLFSTSGPPLVYHFYRQPLDRGPIRETLVAIFGLNALFRLILVIANDAFPTRSYWPAFLALPLVFCGTHLARRVPPPISTRSLQIVVFVLLALSGLSLAVPAILQTAENLTS